MPGLLINIDVPDLAAAELFYTSALGLTAARRFDADIVELTGSVQDARDAGEST